MENSYSGFIADGRPSVLCNGTTLPDCTDIVNHSPCGFAWGYGGSGPAQLALAIMVKEYGRDLEQHPCHYQKLKSCLIAELESDSPFEFSSSRVRELVDLIAR